MTTSVKPIPDGYTALTPHILVDGAAAAIDFYVRAFGAEEVFRMPTPDGQHLLHAEITIGGARLMLADAMPGADCATPRSLGGTAVSLMIYTEDVDALFERAVAAGATVVMPLADMFWGDRYGRVNDPFGHSWSIATHIADPSEEDIRAGMEQAMAQGAV